MDITIITICITAIIITFFIYMLFKDKSGGHIEYDTKTGKILLKRLTENNKDTQNNNAEHIENKAKELKQFKREDYITQLSIYKDFTFIINSATLKVFSDCILFLVKNKITQKSQLEYNSYATEKVKLFTNYYNESFKNSVNPALQKLNIKSILGFYNNISLSEFRTFYSNVYNNHLELDKKNKENLEMIKQKTETEELKLQLLQASILNSYNELIYSDTQLLRDALNNFNNILLGLFYDSLKDIISGS